MGGTCCKDVDTRRDDGEVTLPKAGGENQTKLPPRKVQIRKTVHEQTIGLDNDDVEARRGAADPDLDKIREEAEQRQQAKEASKAKAGFAHEENGQKTSFSDLTEVIPRNQDEPVALAKRCQGRKGTGFVKSQNVAIEDDDDDDENDDDEYPVPQSQASPQKRSKERKGTGFVKRQNLPAEDDEDEDE
jgi:hypothetical protein